MAKWKIDPVHTTANFKVQHLGFAQVPGQITNINGDIDFDPTNPTDAKFTAELDVTTVNTGFAQRDGHLKSPDFFDAEKFPKMTFSSTSVEKITDEKFKVKGNLTIKDVTKEVEMEVNFLGEGDKPNMDQTISHIAAFEISTEIDRRDFGLNWNIDLPGGNLLVGNKVIINIDLEAIRQ